MARSETLLAFSGKKEDISSIVNVAADFSSRDTGAPDYLKSVFIEANESGEVTAVGDSSLRAARTTTKDLEVKSPGRVLVLTHFLTNVLGVINPGEDVDIECVRDGNATKMAFTSGDKHVEIPVMLVSDNDHVPDVGDYISDEFIQIKSQDFINSMSQVSFAVDSERRTIIMSGVFFRKVDNRAIVIGSNAKGMFASTFMDIDHDSAEGNMEMILEPQLISGVSGYLLDGEFVRLHDDEQGQVHLLVVSESGETLHHIRLATIGKGASSKYPLDRLMTMAFDFLSKSPYSFEMDKSDFIQMMRNATKIGSLDPVSHGGQQKQVQVALGLDWATVTMDGAASFEDRIDMKGMNAQDDTDTVSFKLYWGLYSQAFTGNPETERIYVHIAAHPKTGDPAAIVLSSTMELPEPGSLGDGSSINFDSVPTYLTMFPIADGEVIERD